MARTLAFVFGLAAATLLTAAMGCTSTGDGVSDAAASDAHAGGDASFEASGSACLAAGGHCATDCLTAFGPEDCGSQAACCHDVCPADADNVPIQASHYDQSCTLDTDCVMAAFGNTCTQCLSCPNAAINKASEPQYNADVRKALLGEHGGISCDGCFVFEGRMGEAAAPYSDTCCLGGMCQYGSRCQDRVSTRDAATEASIDATADGRPSAP